MMHTVGCLEQQAGLAEWQTLMPQKHLSERACGFESRTRHL
jgi:hypothetical protein